MKILDATAGLRSMWIDKHYKDAIYIDIRPEVKPDIICDSKHTPFENQTFDMIVFDPPHLHSNGNNSIFGSKYGGPYEKQYILDFVQGAFIEFERILKDEGVVMFKWSERDIELDKILKYTYPFIPIFGQFWASRYKGNTSWTCLVKDKKQVQL